MGRTDETIVPTRKISDVIDRRTAETLVPTENGSCESVSLDLAEGSLIGEGYIVQEKLAFTGTQAVFYRVIKEEKNEVTGLLEKKEYVLKLYHKSSKPDEGLLRMIRSDVPDNLIRIYEYGEYDGSVYVISEYYHEGSLENEIKIRQESLRNVVLPSLLQGLDYLHKKGYVHTDLKPANLFWSKDKKSLVIGDLALCIKLSDDGFAERLVSGTPEYSVDTYISEGVEDWESYRISYDFGSVGLILYRFLTGSSFLFGINTRSGWRIKLDSLLDLGRGYPREISIEWRKLIRNLIDPNKDTRWGLNQIRNWLNTGHERKGGASRYVDGGAVRGFTYCVNDEPVYIDSLDEIITAILNNWKSVAGLYRMSEFLDFLARVKPEIRNEIIKLKDEKNEDVAIYKMLCILGYTSKIFYRGEDFGTVRGYLEALNRGEKKAYDFLVDGLFTYYLKKKNERVDSEVRQIEELIHKYKNDEARLRKEICNRFLNKPFIIRGIKIVDLNSFVRVIHGMSVGEQLDLLESDDTLVWLSRFGIMI